MEQIVKLTNQTTSNDNILSNQSDVGKEYEKFSVTMPIKNGADKEPGLITPELLDAFLYGKRKIQAINLEEAKRQKTTMDSLEKKNAEMDGKTASIWCETCRTKHAGSCLSQRALKVLHQVVGNTVHDIKLTYAILSFPPEVQLCTSSVPGYSYGVAAKQPFPIGTWIGPYEGTRVKAGEITKKTDTNYVWEIYEDGKFSHYLDGNDENGSSWMRFIRCARHKGEQNMVVFQYGNNIYYRAVRDIPAGTELLVWYNNNYTQFLGVPLGLRTVPGSNKGQEKAGPGQHASKAQTSPEVESKPVLKEQNYETPSVKSPHNKIPECVYSTRQMLTTTTYCYSASNPTTMPHSVKYLNGLPANNVHVAKPTVTIEHRPSVTDAAISKNHMTSPGNGQRQQYLAPYSGPSPITTSHSDVNNNYFRFPSSSVPVLPEDRLSPGNEPGKTWKCNQCLKTFNQRLLLQMHTCVKSPERPYQCGHCSDSFSQPSELRNHVVAHSNDRPFKCGFCGRSFAGATTLNNHMRTHTGERPFLCNNCGRTFSIATQLSRHMRTPGECPMAGNASEFRDTTPPYTSTLTRG